MTILQEKKIPKGKKETKINPVQYFWDISCAKARQKWYESHLKECEYPVNFEGAIHLHLDALI